MRASDPASAATGRPPGKKIPYKWIALSVTTIGSLMAALDSTIVILALPDRRRCAPPVAPVSPVAGAAVHFPFQQ